jgi:multimeric flavodoxin WrbA
MTRVLGIVGSPRRNGNTHLLVSKILEGAQAAGAVTDLILLNTLKIQECDGCHACWRGKPCSKPDDMQALYPKIAESDVLVFGTPVYWYGPTALMKGFVDRFVYFNGSANRAKIKNKLAIIAVPFEEENPETADLIVAFFEKSLGFLEMSLAGQVIVPGVSRKGDILNKPGHLAAGYALGQKAAGRSGSQS